MKYINGEPVAEGEEKIGVLITNLGTPEAPDTKSLRKYLGEFLADPRVVEIPKLIWLVILYGIILVFRPKKSAEAYQEVWTERGSPLKFYTEDQAAGIQASLNEDQGDSQGVLVEYGMRYGHPSISSGIDKLLKQGCDRLLVLPLYPQYASSTTGSTFDAIAKDFTHRRLLPQLRFVAKYYDFPLYIQAVAESIQRHWDEHGRAEKLVLSYHGLPKYTHDKGDPYFMQCHKTTSLIAEYLNLNDDEYLTVFQSRFGKAEWLKPYTDQTLKSLAKSGTKSVQVVCPGFSSDCLETIEEIDVENREYFMESGGQRYEYIPALNASKEHIAVLAKLVQENLKGWVA